MFILKNKIIFLMPLVLLGFLIISNCQLVSAATFLEGFNNSLKTTGNIAGYKQDPSAAATSLTTTTIGKIIAEALGSLGVIFLFLIIYGGYVWMKARGNEADVKRGKDIMIDALIGLIIVAAAYAVSYFVVGSF